MRRRRTTRLLRTGALRSGISGVSGQTSAADRGATEYPLSIEWIIGGAVINKFLKHGKTYRRS